MKIGDYVRTNIGTIFKVDKDEIHALEENKKWNLQYGDNAYVEAVKSSSNIIDLIEEGDYVNGLRVEKNKYGELYTSYVYYGGDIGKQCELYTTWLEEYKENEDWIETIVTKKQFESMKYKVGEE